MVIWELAVGKEKSVYRMVLTLLMKVKEDSPEVKSQLSSHGKVGVQQEEWVLVLGKYV